MTQELCLIHGGIWQDGESCDSGICDGDGGPCSAGFIVDCIGNCQPINWIGDGICDAGEYDAYFNCAQFACDGGDCADSICNLPALDGACCTSSGCIFLSYTECIGLSGTFMGESIQCNANTCSCPEGFIPDCNGYCIPIYLLGDNDCQHGDYIDEYIHIGDPGFAQIDMQCVELACDSGDCVAGSCSGACCVSGSCTDNVTFDECIQLGGNFQGTLTLCDDISCEEKIRSILLTDHTLIRPDNANSGNGLQSEGGIGLSCASHGNMAVIGHSD
ncbi:MAG: hypothetical protein MK095_10350, partial [Phycisphaerales bacterium]|nr:hypothetical protein [Phycisphaerales bacterium]